MKGLPVRVAVGDLDTSVKFYSSLFAAEPSVLKSDYAKWMLDDPRLNFSVTTRPARKGVNHLGIQVENAAELAGLRDRMDQAGRGVLDQKDTKCCYARSDKAWTLDPEGVAWEAFLTSGEAAEYGETRELEGAEAEAEAGSVAACCGPAPRRLACC